MFVRAHVCGCWVHVLVCRWARSLHVCVHVCARGCACA